MFRKFEVVIPSLVFVLATCFITGVFTGCAVGKIEELSSTHTGTIADPIGIESGLVAGKLVGEAGREVRTYLGIPYAAPPVGDLRWRAPQPVVPWSGVRDCRQYSKTAPQDSDGAFDFPQDEDCLYLNVLTPVKEKREKLPVMLWLHPGGYAYGSGNDPLFNHYRLPLAGVVVVTLNMRLGVFGLMAHPELSKESSQGVSGNYMFLDILASLEWIKKNIAAFGGDPDNVTIFGESGGGIKIAALIASPLSKGLFKRAICQSGPTVPGSALSDLEKTGENLFAKLGVSTLEEARKIPWQEVLAANKDLKTDAIWNLAIDGWFINDNPESIFSTGGQNAVQIMVGLNQGELSTTKSAIYLISGYMNMLSGTRKKGAEGYAYVFDQVPINWRANGGIAIHALDLSYVFGDYDNSVSSGWTTSFQIESLYGVGPEEKVPALSETDQKVSEAMMAMWAQFARTGNPSVEGLATVSAWNPDADEYLYLADPLTVKTGFSQLASAEKKIAEPLQEKPRLSRQDMDRLMGAWMGKPVFPEGFPVTEEDIPLFVFRFEMTREGEFAGFFDMPDQGISGTTITNIELKDDVLSFEIPDLQSSKFSGKLSDSELTGKLNMGGPSYAITLVKGRYEVQAYSLDLPPEIMDQLLGTWEGEIGAFTSIFRFEKTEAGQFLGFLDSLDQGVNGIQFTEAALKDERLVLEAAGINGEFTGQLSGDALVGEWSQMGSKQPISLIKITP